MILVAALVAAVAAGGVFFYERRVSVSQPQPQPPPPPQPAQPKAQPGLTSGGTGLNGNALQVLTQIGSVVGKAVAGTLAGGPQTQWTKDNAAAIGAGIGLGAFAVEYGLGVAFLSLPGLAIATAVAALTTAAIGYTSIVDSAETDKDNAKRAADVRASKDANDYPGAWEKCAAWARARSQVDAKGNVSLVTQQTYFNSVPPTSPAFGQPGYVPNPDALKSSWTPLMVNVLGPDGKTTTQVDTGKVLDLAYDTRQGGTPDAYATGALQFTAAEFESMSHVIGGGGARGLLPLDVLMQQALAAKNRAAVAQYYGDLWAFTLSQQVPWLTTVPRGLVVPHPDTGAKKIVGGRIWQGTPPYMRNVCDVNWGLTTAQVKATVQARTQLATAEVQATRSGGGTVGARTGVAISSGAATALANQQAAAQGTSANNANPTTQSQHAGGQTGKGAANGGAYDY